MEERSEEFSEIDEYNSPVGSTKTAGYNFEMLKATIISMSESQEWNSAKEEWKFVRLYKKRYGKCPCDHYPITDHCVIENQENGNEMFLGNCCIRHISEAQHKRAQKIWQIFRDPKIRANQDLIDHAFSQGFLTLNEKNIYEALPKRKRTDTQNKLMLELNLKIIRNWDAKKTKFGMDPLHLIEIHYESSDQALYYKCTECEYKVKFHEGKERNLEDGTGDCASEAEAEEISCHEDRMEEEFEGDNKAKEKRNTRLCVDKKKIQDLFDGDTISSERSSDEENVPQDENFEPSQSCGEEEESLDDDMSEDEASLTSESIEDDEDNLSYNSSEDEDNIFVENNAQEEEDFNQALRTTSSLRNREDHSNQQQHSNSDKFIYGEDGEALYQ